MDNKTTDVSWLGQTAKQTKARRHGGGGGKARNPASLANLTRGLAAALAAPRCERCNQPAVRGMTRCRRHGGAVGLAGRSKADPDALQARRRVAKIEREGAIPPGLAALGVWRLMRVKRAAVSGAILRDLLEGYLMIERGEGGELWADALRRARAVVGDGVQIRDREW